jgi:Ca2+-binding EF-hand superfamily protein
MGCACSRNPAVGEPAAVVIHVPEADYLAAPTPASTPVPAPSPSPRAPTPIPLPSDLSSREALREVVATLTAGEQHAECCICFDELHEEPCAAFMLGGRRTCPHLFHEACASDVLRTAQKLCPVCRHDVDATVRVPDVTADPDGWFGCIDVEGDGLLSRVQVVHVLVSQFPIDQEKLEEALPSLWARWDVSGSGFITRAEFLDTERGLLSFVRRELLHQPLTPRTARSSTSTDGAPSSPSATAVPIGAAAAASSRQPQPPSPASGGGRHAIATESERDTWERDPAVWFAIFDENQSGRLSRDQLVRALVRSSPRLSLQGAHATIDRLELLPGAATGGTAESITLERFVAIHEILLSTIEEQADSSLDTLLAMLAAAHGDDHGITRERAFEALANESGVLVRAYTHLSEVVLLAHR